MHAGLVTDIFLTCGAIVYGFEPNQYLYGILQNKYANNPNVTIYNKAVSNKNYTTKFLQDTNILSEGNRIMQSVQNTQETYDVSVVDLSEILQQLILQYKQIYCVKLDIEGAEFDVMDKIIEKELYKHITYIVCETHERFFNDGDEKIGDLQAKIKQHNITNILLDWI